MVNLSEHFTLEEMTRSQTASRFDIDNTPPPVVLSSLKRLANTLEKVRTICNAPIRISSGYRCAELNQMIGGSKTSQHIRGEACDFTVFGMDLDTVIRRIMASDIKYDQLIKEFNSWVHISIADKPRRQALIIDRTGTRFYG